MNNEPKNTNELVFLTSISVILVLIAGGSLTYFWNRMPPELPWFYSLPWGEAQLIPRAGFWIGLAGLVLVNAANWFLAKAFAKRDHVVASVIMGANILVTLLYLTSFYKVMSVLIY